MPICKQCAIKYSIWSASGDGLCKECGSKADIRKNEEEQQKNLANLKNKIELIIKVITSEQPLIFTFNGRV